MLRIKIICAVEISSDTGNKGEEERSAFTYMTDSETRSFRSKRPRYCKTAKSCRTSEKAPHNERAHYGVL